METLNHPAEKTAWELRYWWLFSHPRNRAQTTFYSHFVFPLFCPDRGPHFVLPQTSSARVRGLRRSKMSGGRLCAVLGELGFDAQDALDPDSFEWPFQYEEVRPLLDWICSSLRPSNVLSPSELSQYNLLLLLLLSLLFNRYLSCNEGKIGDYRGFRWCRLECLSVWRISGLTASGTVLLFVIVTTCHFA